VQDIEQGRYDVVVTNPEILVTSSELKDLWKKSSFTQRLLGFVFDEGHCISQWGGFRKHYLAVGIIRYLITNPVAFYVTSATLPPPIIAEIRRLLHINPDTVTEILCSNDCPDIALRVQEMKCPSSSYEDLGFLIPHNWQTGMDKPQKFLVFFDDIKEAEAATKFLHQRLLRDHHSKVT
jgi:superfamily II DNA helicase RecQ